jgi:DNA-binding response OmpR family regulator
MAIMSGLQQTPARPCCLIAEDQALIGMSLEAYLDDMGFAVAGPFTTPGEALAWLAANEPNLAILDYRLGEGTCADIARELNARGVPVIVYSGVPRGIDVPPELQAACWLEKPAPRPALLKVVMELLPDRAANEARPN